MTVSAPNVIGSAVSGSVPSAPTNVTSIAKDAKATLSWLAPASGPAPTGYKITPYIAGVAQSPTTVGNVLTADVTSLTNSTAYTFTVKGTNAGGDGSESAASGANTPRVNQIFGDEFNGSVLDPAWFVMDRDSDQSNAELAFYKPSQVTLDGSGNLKLLCEHVDVTQATYSDALYPANNGLVTRNYRSGAVQMDTFVIPAPISGKPTTTVEFAGKMPLGLDGGVWVGSLWLMGTELQVGNHLNPDNVNGGNWPSSGEVDIAEFGSPGQGTKDATRFLCNYFSAGVPSGSVFEKSGITDANINQHVYRLDWTWVDATHTQMVWKIDGAIARAAVTTDLIKDMFAMINVTIVGTVSATFPVSMLIDYVRVTSA